MRSERERVLDMLEAIERIERYARKGREAFERDELIQYWFVHHLALLGEAAGRLGREFHAKHPELPWQALVSMRNVLIHEYFGVDMDEIWAAVVKDVPALKADLEAVLPELDE